MAYGIGAPVLFLTNDGLAEVLAVSTRSNVISGLFLGGVAAQVGLAALNKTVMWACYFAERHPKVRSKRRFRAAAWLADLFLIDLAVDLGTLVSFACATWILFGVVTGSPILGAVSGGESQ